MLSERDMMNIALELSQISAYNSEHPLQDVMETLCKYQDILLSTLWKIKYKSQSISAIARAGYNPDPEDYPNEYFCQIKNTHVESFIESAEFKNGDIFKINDVKSLADDSFFNTKERIEELGLSLCWMIPIKTPDSGVSRYFLNIYFQKDTNIESVNNGLISAIKEKISILIQSDGSRSKNKLNNYFSSSLLQQGSTISEMATYVIKQVSPNICDYDTGIIFLISSDGNVSFSYDSSSEKVVEISISELRIIKNLISDLPECSDLALFKYINLGVKVFDESQSLIAYPIKSDVYSSGVSGAIVLLNRSQSLSKRDFNINLPDSFDKDVESLLDEIASRFSLLHDIYMHEDSKKQVINLLAHEILSPSIYIKNTSRRVIRKSPNIPFQQKMELENLSKTAEMQISVCDGIFMSFKEDDIPPYRVYRPMNMPVFQEFENLKRIVYPICENHGVINDDISVDFFIKPLFIDPRVMRAIFLNMCTNAIKYNSQEYIDGHKFKFICKAEEIYNNEKMPPMVLNNKLPKGVLNSGYTVFSFTDYGIGIPEENKEDIFLPFFRVPGKDAETQSGSGLGLSIVRKLVEDHLGVIWLARLRNPTIFRVALPMMLQNETYQTIRYWRTGDRS